MLADKNARRMRLISRSRFQGESRYRKKMVFNATRFRFNYELIWGFVWYLKSIADKSNRTQNSQRKVRIRGCLFLLPPPFTSPFHPRAAHFAPLLRPQVSKKPMELSKGTSGYGKADVYICWGCWVVVLCLLCFMSIRWV